MVVAVVGSTNATRKCRNEGMQKFKNEGKKVEQI